MQVLVTELQKPLVQSLFCAHVAHSAAPMLVAQAQTLLRWSQVKEPQSVLAWQPWLQTPCTQLPLAQSVLAVQVAQSAAVPSAEQVHCMLFRSQACAVPQSVLTWQLAEQRPAVVSQMLLAQSAFAAQVLHTGLAQVQAPVLVSQAKPGQSMSLEHAWRQRPVTQLPLAQSVPTAQVAQSAAVPVGATQRQVWAGSWQVPPGQSESTAQDPVQRPAVVSQVLLAQVVLALHAAHAGEPQEH